MKRATAVASSSTFAADFEGRVLVATMHLYESGKLVTSYKEPSHLPYGKENAIVIQQPVKTLEMF